MMFIAMSATKIIDDLIKRAAITQASDIHLDPLAKSIRVRFRIDGILEDLDPLSKEMHNEIISKIKVLSGLRTDEHQAAQDGRFKSMQDFGEIDIRVSIVPTYYGENAVLRLLSDRSENFTLENLGFDNSDVEKIKNVIHRPTGMILVTGPTGSGKTTTLYTLIKMLNTKEVAIVTIEDPIEYSIEGIEQIQVQERTGLNFAQGLRSILRQDPNIIMVGEIRDTETAKIAVNTALTGHLLLSTLHTNDVGATLPRLIDMKIEPFLVASTISLVIGQRLVRKICEACKERKNFDEEELARLRQLLPANTLEENKNFWRGAGCVECNNTGFKGRIVLSEIMVADTEIKNAILRKASASEIRQIAYKNGMKSMPRDGINKAYSGLTTIHEVLRAVYE